MIHDKLEYASLYEKLSPGFEAAFRWLAATDLSSIPEGRVDILGSSVFATRYRYTTASRSGKTFESHRDFADLQVILKGREIMVYRQVEGLEPETDYDASKDYASWKQAGGLDLCVESGEFAVFFPQDAHLPKIEVSGPEEVEKLVIKIAL